MDPLIEELNEISAEMTSLVAAWEATGHEAMLRRLAIASDKVGDAWSGSSIGYHANVYYEGFQPPPPSCHFSSEWGLHGPTTTGRWKEWTSDEVMKQIEHAAGSPDLGPVDAFVKSIRATVERNRRAILSILDVVLAHDGDTYLSEVRANPVQIEIRTEQYYLDVMLPKKAASRDALAVRQGLRHAPHQIAFARAASLKSPVLAAQELAALSQDVAQHLRRRDAVHASRAPAMAPDAPVDTSACDVLLVTVTTRETKAVMDALVSVVGRPETTWGEVKSYFRFPPINNTRVVLVRSEMGSDSVGGSSTTIRDALSEVKPKAIIMVGIAFGVKESEQPIGHVLVSHQLQPYDLMRVGTDKTSGAQKITPRGDRVTASAKLLDRLRTAELGFTGSIQFGLVLSGQSLIDNLDYRQELQASHPEAIGGEMEGAGLYSAATGKADWIVVKAVCDYADGNKAVDKADRQKTAAEAAAAFVLHTLQMGGLAP